MSEKSKTAEREEEILKFWQENKIFEKSLEKESPKGNFVFYDGPPFATGLPHYGHILAGTMKDVIPRYKTMQGYNVRRVWGWDCHGLPIENLIEKELGLETKRDIEKFGIKKFNQAAQDSVLRYDSEWKKIIPRVGRWIDMENAYKTMDSTYTESVWASFKKLYDKGLVYEGFKSMHLCPRCGTTLSNFEVNQGYKDITDISVYVKFELVNEPKTFLLAWTTTPWTLPGNAALAVNIKEKYIKIKIKDEFFILAKARLSVIKEEYESGEEINGKDLIGLEFKPLFDYFSNEKLENRKNAWKVYGADFVTMEDGTGIVHIAPAFGEDDMNFGNNYQLPFIQHVDIEGKFKPEIVDFAGQVVKPKSTDEDKNAHQSADVLVIKYLAHHNTLFAKEKIIHSYPHCWRCDTPLLNYATSSWFVKVTDLKERMIELNNKIKWVPQEIGQNRFGKWLEGARDWAVSRSRYWGAPLPVWRSVRREGGNKIGEVKIIGSVDDLRKLSKKSGNKYFVMRHGEAESNVTGTTSYKTGSTIKLTPKGIEQVKASALYLDDKKITKIYSSTFSRAQETAKIVAQELGLPVESIVYDDRLVDINTGEFEGKTWNEYFSFFKDQYERFFKTPSGAESLTDVKKRVGNALYEIDELNKNENVLIVAHGITLWMLEAVSQATDMLGTIHIRTKNQTDPKSDYIGNAVIKDLDFVPLPHNQNYELDLHRPYIDEVELFDENGDKLERIKEVFDTWYDSGSMPYAQLHYPFSFAQGKKLENSKFEDFFPADFIAEGLDQTRGWFYTLLVLGAGLFDKSPFNNVIVNGTVLAEDGQKMSKRLKNYPDPMYVIQKYGADSLRYYLLTSSVVRAEDLAFSERGLDEVHKKLFLRLRNVLDFYLLYKNSNEKINANNQSKNILDRWIFSRLNELGSKVTESIDRYELDRAARPFMDFVDDLSTWYLRRSRERFKSFDISDKNDAQNTITYVLKTLAKYLAPFAPFFAEDMHRELKEEGDEESVHLCSWPEAGEVDQKLLEEMQLVRNMVSEILMIRNKENIKVRQPLGKLTIQNDQLENKPDLVELIKDEVNVKEIVFDKQLNGGFSLDTTITEDLKKEGQMREFVRAVQDLRKQKGLEPSDTIKLLVDTDEKGKAFIESLSEEIKKPTNVSEIIFESNDGEVVEFENLKFRICIP